MSYSYIYINQSLYLSKNCLPRRQPGRFCNQVDVFDVCVCVFVSTTFWNVGLLCPILMPHVLYHDILDNQVRRTPNLSRLWRSHSVGCQRRQTNVHPKDPNSPPIEEQTSGSFFFFQSYQTTRQRHPPKPSTAVTAGAVAGPFATLGLDPGCPVPLLQPSAVR